MYTYIYIYIYIHIIDIHTYDARCALIANIAGGFLSAVREGFVVFANGSSRLRIHMYRYKHIYIYIYIERERENM